MRMGRLDDAKRLLMQVVNAAPKRENDLLMAGELFLQSGDAQQGIALLSRAESLHPSSHAEVMLAVAYLKLKQPERARQLLEQARSHDPKNPSVFRAVANFYREQHDYKAAISALKSAPGQNSRCWPISATATNLMAISSKRRKPTPRPPILRHGRSGCN